MVVPPDVLRDYQAFLDGRDPLAVTDYSGPHSRRDVIECVLFQQALALGGLTARVGMEPVSSYGRITLELQSGEALAGATSIWRRDLAPLGDDVLISPPMIREGEFEAGLYASPGNERAMGARDLADISRLTAVCNPQWGADWDLLTRLGPGGLMSASGWRVMVCMTSQERADFLLAPFQPTPGLRLAAFGATLAPIPGLKVRMPDSRHFGVSRRHPQGERVFRALVAGLKRMRAAGTIVRAYTESGFFNPAVRDWKVLHGRRDTAGFIR
ncbi:hypothetical protein [Pseudodesulfovibrio sp.]|uniref:hypothetical protein n=1 Tax=Pseudodesulfovibrio sp. TaxID=2035812 RepID=UPI0026095D6E|nr:hypothetical protein [Pseudodesulfovibrio sp.]MDD3312702.1 hypothetical protein [Pseudodesulfovibrio sp.]